MTVTVCGEPAVVVRPSDAVVTIGAAADAVVAAAASRTVRHVTSDVDVVRSFPLGCTGKMRVRWSIRTRGRGLAWCAGTAVCGRLSGWLSSRRRSRSSLTRPESLPAPSGRRSTQPRPDRDPALARATRLPQRWGSDRYPRGGAAGGGGGGGVAAPRPGVPRRLPAVPGRCRGPPARRRRGHRAGAAGRRAGPLPRSRRG